jgi:hypothetical protein
MAAVTVGTLHPVSPPGYELNDKGQAAVALTKGQLLIITTATAGSGFDKVWDKCTAGALEPHGIALMDAAAGGLVSVGIQGEMDGFTGLTQGAALYPSGSVAGGIDTSLPAGAPTRIRAVTATRIRYNLI